MSAKYEFNDECLSLLPECVKYGVNSVIHTLLIKGGLRDRIALHALSVFVKNEDIPFSSSRKIKRGLKTRLADFDYYIDTSRIPQLSKNKIKAWLG